MLLSQELLKGIILVVYHLGISDHARLNVEASVANKHDSSLLALEHWRSAPKHLTFTSGLFLWQDNFCEPILFLEQCLHSDQGRVKLDDPKQVQLLVSECLQIDAQRLDQVRNVNADLDEHIEHLLNGHLRDWHETGVPVVDHKVAAQLFGSNVVNAARAIRHVAQDQAFNLTKGFQNVGNQVRMHQQTFWELQRDFVLC